MVGLLPEMAHGPCWPSGKCSATRSFKYSTHPCVVFRPQKRRRRVRRLRKQQRERARLPPKPQRKLPASKRTAALLGVADEMRVTVC